MQERVKRKLSHAGNLGLAAALVLAGIYAVRSMIGGTGAGAPAQAVASRVEPVIVKEEIASLEAGQEKGGILERLAERDVFGEGAGEASERAVNVAEMLDGNLELRGTIAGDAQVARAIVSNKKENATRLYKIGDVLGPGRLKAIGRQSVIVEADGRDMELRLKASQNASAEKRGATPSEPAAIPASNETVFSGEISTAEEQKMEPAPRASRVGERVIETILTRVNLEEEKQGEAAIGLRISNLSAVPVARLIGLQENDVITAINGQSVASKQKAFQVVRKLQSQTRVDIELIRNNQKELLSFPLTWSEK